MEESTQGKLQDDRLARACWSGNDEIVIPMECMMEALGLNGIE